MMQSFTQRIEEIHNACFELCKQAVGEYLSVAGNIGIFCQSDGEYNRYLAIAKDITKSSDNPNQKYFDLIESVTIKQNGVVPEATYTHVYIRKPADDSPQVGDIDFVLERSEFDILKEKIRINTESIPGASIYERPGWDMVEVRNLEINAIAYISYQEMAEKVRIRF